MRAMFSGLVVCLLFVGGCNPCDCEGVSAEAPPEGDFTIDDASQDELVDGAVSIADEVLLVRYTDEDGNQWEVEYAVVSP